MMPDGRSRPPSVDVRFGGQCGESGGGRADPHVDPVVDTGGGPRLASGRQVFVGDVEAHEPPTVGQAARQPERRHPGERADLHDDTSTDQRHEHRHEAALVLADVHHGQTAEPLGRGRGERLGDLVADRVGVRLDVGAEFL